MGGLRASFLVSPSLALSRSGPRGSFSVVPSGVTPLDPEQWQVGPGRRRLPDTVFSMSHHFPELVAIRGWADGDSGGRRVFVRRLQMARGDLGQFFTFRFITELVRPCSRHGGV